MCVPVHECARGRVGATAIRSRTQLGYHKRCTHVSDQLQNTTSSYNNSFWAEVVVWTAPSFEERETEGETKITFIAKVCAVIGMSRAVVVKKTSRAYVRI